MGIFTEQVQGIVSEERTKRQERERKQREKNFLQELEQKLYYLFIDTFMENTDAKKTYIFLTSYDTKCELLRYITKNIRTEKQDYFFYLLDLKYNKILNNVKQNFLQKQKEEEKEKKIQFQAYNLARLQRRATFIKKRKYKPLLFFYLISKKYILYILLWLKIFIRIVFEPLFLLSNILICLTILKSLKTSYTQLIRIMLISGKLLWICG